MIDLTVKTLDSQNHAFSVNDDITVRQFKEHIAETVNIPADLQRLIYCGRVLQDEKNLSEYDVNGKVIHLVQRAPPSMHQRPNSSGQSQSQNQNQSGDWPSGPRIHYRQTQFHGNPMYVGSVSIPADVLEGHAEWPIPQLSNTLANSHLTVVQRMLDHANRVIDRLENPNANGNGNGSASSTETTTPQAPEAQSSSNEETQASTASPEPIVEEPADSPREETEPTPGSSTESSTNEALVPRQLAELLEKLLATQDRLRPYIRDRILASSTSTAEENQRIMDGVSECFHFLSHAQHALSDISIDMQQAPPRTIRCRPMIIQPSAILQAGLPIQVEAHISLHGQSDNNNAESENSTPTTQPQTTSTTTETTTSSTETPEPRPPRPERTERGSNIRRLSETELGQVFNFPNNVEVVMEMGPQTPRVWSFSTGGEQPQGNNNNNNTSTNNNNTTTGGAGTSGGSGFSWGAAPSPDIIRNLMQAVAGYMAQTGVPMPAPSTTATSSTASTTSSNPTVGCLRHRARTAVGVGESASSQPRANTDTHPTTSTQTRTTSRTHVFHQHAQALGVGVNVAHSLEFDPFLPCNSQHVRRHQAQTSTAASTQTGSSSGTDASTQSQSGTTMSSSTGPRFATITGVQIVNNSFNGPSLAESIANAERFSRPDRPISFNNFLLNRGIHLASNFDFLSSGRQRTVLQRIYMVLSKLSVSEWFRVLGGDYAPLTLEIQEALRATLREAFPSASEDNLPTQVAETIVQELRPHLERTFDGEGARDDRGEQVAMRETIENLLNVHISSIVRCLFTTYDTNTAFVEAALEHIKRLATNLIGCCRLALRGEQGGFERVVARFASQMTRGTHEVFREWILGTVVEWFCTYSRTVQQPEKEEVRKLLWYKDRQRNSTSSQLEAAASQAPTPSPQPIVQPIPEPMETDSGPDPLMLDDSEEVPATFPGHENLLPDWVPIIARDGARQRRQLQLGLSGGSVTTLSDAYLATMPSKRRKLVEQQKPTLLASPTPNNSAIPASMERLVRESVGRAGVEEVDGAAAAVASDPTVRRAFGQAIRECLNPRRYQTPDFPDPLRFPNATKFFSDQDRHGKQ